jgi:hypothetical protein
LAPRWRGPFQIVSIDGAYLRLKSLIKDEALATHLNNCKSFTVADGVNPAAVAALDDDEYFVEKIIAQRPEKLSGPKKSWQFLVRWLGYSPAQDEWLPYMQLRDTTALRTWLTNNNNNNNKK